jgi:hypothetical protein
MPTDGPSALLDFDIFAKLAAHDRQLPLETDAKHVSLDDYIQVATASALGYRDHNIQFSDLLLPGVGESLYE